METLSEKPSLAEMKRVGNKALADYHELVKGLDQFGRKPGEGWQALADEFIGRVLELDSLMKRLSGKGYTLPAREYREIAPSLARALDSLGRQWPKLVDSIIAACPDEVVPLPSEPLVRAAFEEYDRKAAELSVSRFQRRAVQKLLRRAEKTTAVPILLLSGPGRGDNMKVFDLIPLLQTLLMYTPLPLGVSLVFRHSRRNPWPSLRGRQLFGDRGNLSISDCIDRLLRCARNDNLGKH